MNSFYPDASNRYTSLDDIYYFGGQAHRLNVAVLSHIAIGPQEIDLQVADQIFVAGNHWDGYSKGKNLRTNSVGLYPTFKVIIDTRVHHNYLFTYLLHTKSNQIIFCFIGHSGNRNRNNSKI